MKEIIKNELYLVRKNLYRISRVSAMHLRVLNADSDSFIFSLDIKESEIDARKQAIKILKKLE